MVCILCVMVSVRHIMCIKSLKLIYVPPLHSEQLFIIIIRHQHSGVKKKTLNTNVKY